MATPRVPPNCCAVGSSPDSELTAAGRTRARIWAKTEAVNTPKPNPPTASTRASTQPSPGTPSVTATSRHTAANAAAEAVRAVAPKRRPSRSASTLPTSAPAAYGVMTIAVHSGL